MSYSDTCAANPAKTPCPFSCTCQGHVRGYPNQDCACPQPELSLPKPWMLIDSSAFFQEYGSLIAHSTYATREEAVAECARVNAARNPGYKTYAGIPMRVIQHPTELPPED